MSKPPVSRALRGAVNWEDFRKLAEARLPRVLFEFIDGASEDEATLRANRAAFAELCLKPRQGVAFPAYDLKTSVLGIPLAFPALIAPCGNARMVHPDGGLALARAAHRAGIGYIAPQMGGHRLEDVRAASDGPLWFQIYKIGGREIAELAIKRARAAGYGALVVTIENPQPPRDKDLRNGLRALMTGSAREALPYYPQMLARPAWLCAFLTSGWKFDFPNTVTPSGEVLDRKGVARVNPWPGQSFVWEDFKWLRDVWPGTIVVKGIITAEDARRAVDVGAAAIVVSNHGGRSIDGAPAALRMLPEIAAAVGTQTEILFDSGVRRGADVIKALCLGARAVLIGRPSMYALSYGQPGVERLLELLRFEIACDLAALGCGSVRTLDQSWILPAYANR